MQIIFYKKDNGREPVKEFIEKLDKSTRSDIYGCLLGIEKDGLNSNRADFRQIEGKLWEIKIKTIGGGYRVFYTVLQKELIILLHSYKKETQKAPKKEIEVALQRMKDCFINDEIR